MRVVAVVSVISVKEFVAVGISSLKMSSGKDANVSKLGLSMSAIVALFSLGYKAVKKGY